MEVHVNNQSQQTEEGAILSELLHKLGFEESRGIAIAINDQVLPKTAWNSHALSPNDHITIIRATQGG